MDSLKSKHVLILDDESDVVRILRLMLMAWNYRISTALRVPEALEMILNGMNTADPVDIILADIQIPGQNGFDLMDELAARNVSVPTIFMTGLKDQDTQVELNRRGVCACLEKPVSFQVLLDQVRNIPSVCFSECAS